MNILTDKMLQKLSFHANVTKIKLLKIFNKLIKFITVHSILILETYALLYFSILEIYLVVKS